jgi:acetyl-CoA carboxylase carboxyl transferase subunit beta
LVKPIEQSTQPLLDLDSWRPVPDDLSSSDPLDFPGYPGALEERKVSPEDESVKAGPGLVSGLDVEYALFDFGFFGGSMGEVSGERLARSMERAAAARVPFLLRTATGGARMQEGMRSLIQMPKVIVARIALAEAQVPFVAILGNPTTGGVFASLASLADVTIAEAEATIGFAGPRVAERFMGHRLPHGSHTAESAFMSGLVDEVVDPDELRDFVTSILMTFLPDKPLEVPPPPEPANERIDEWEAVLRARDEDRPLAHELILEIAESLVVLHGDRVGGVDPAVDIALARIAGRKAVVLALDRQRSPGPAAFREARRAIEIAVRLGLPIVSIVDTPGADPSADSESAGIAGEIARTFQALLSAPVPTLSVVTGEGGSGGALAFCATDVLLAYENSVFSVIGPELAAEILWRDSERGPEAARLLKVSAADLLRLGIADGLVPEPLTPASIENVIAYHLSRLCDAGSGDDLRAARLERWRSRYGHREEST